MVVLIFKLKTIEETDDSHVHKTPHTAQVQLEALSKYRPSTVTITILRGSRGQVPLPAGGPRAGPLERLRSILKSRASTVTRRRAAGRAIGTTSFNKFADAVGSDLGPLERGKSRAPLPFFSSLSHESLWLWRGAARRPGGTAGGGDGA